MLCLIVIEIVFYTFQHFILYTTSRRNKTIINNNSSCSQHSQLKHKLNVINIKKNIIF